MVKTLWTKFWLYIPWKSKIYHFLGWSGHLTKYHRFSLNDLVCSFQYTSASWRSFCWLSSTSTFLPTSSYTCFSRNCSCLLRTAWCSSNEWVMVLATSILVLWSFLPTFNAWYGSGYTGMGILKGNWAGLHLLSECTSHLLHKVTPVASMVHCDASWQMSFSHSKQYNLMILLCFWQVEMRVFVGSCLLLFFISEIGTILCPVNALFLWRLAQAAHTKRQVWQKEVAFVLLKHAQLW